MTNAAGAQRETRPDTTIRSLGDLLSRVTQRAFFISAAKSVHQIRL